MKKLFVCALFAVGLSAAPLVTIQTPDVTIQPGNKAQIRAKVEADSMYWISFVGSFVSAETNAGLGVYSDVTGAKGGPVNFLLAPGSSPWYTLVGEYLIDVTSPPGVENQMALTIQFEQYTGDPSKYGNCWVNAGSLSAAVTVRSGMPAAHNEVPEPGTWALAALGLAVCGLSGRLRQRQVLARRKKWETD